MPLLAAAVLAWLLAAVPARADHSVVEHVSQGTIGGNGAVNTEFRGASRDGSVVLFQTTEQLAAGDTDSAADLYLRAGGVTELVTAGPASTGPTVPNWTGMTPDGGAVFFYTRDALVSADTDTSDDAYMYRAGTTTLLSFGGTPGCFGSQAYPLAWSDDASKVFFQSTDRHSAADTDCDTDLYEYSAGTVSIVHAGPSNTSILDASADGGKVFFTSADPIDPLDTDATNDVYMRDGTAFTQISTGGNGPFNAFATFGGWASPTGDRVYFRTFEQLAAEDTDTAIDTYLWHAGAVELVTAGPAGGNSGADAQVFAFSADGSHAFFSTAEPLVAGDTDASYDLYERSGGTTSLLSTGPAGGNGAFDANQLQHGVSEDGNRVFFLTREKLVASDTNGAFDLYQRSGGETSLALIGPTGASVPGQLHGISADGSRVFFTTNQPLVGADTDGRYDLYERTGSITTLVSLGPGGGNGAYDVIGSCCPPGLVSADGSRVFFDTSESLVSSDTDTSQDIYSASVASGPPAAGYARPKGATPLRVSLVPAYKPCSAPNREHGPPLSFGSCNPPAQESSQLTVGTPDANGPAAAFVASAKYETLAGNAATSADEADVRFDVSITDVRRQGTLADYTGFLRVVSTVRITDKNSGMGSEPATLGDLDMGAIVPCAATVGTAGATCSLSTTFDAITPGFVQEGRRTIWDMDRVRVFDGGPDDNPYTLSDNTLFAVQGVFVP